jgi:hypothetical protein
LESSRGWLETNKVISLILSVFSHEIGEIVIILISEVRGGLSKIMLGTALLVRDKGDTGYIPPTSRSCITLKQEVRFSEG